MKHLKLFENHINEAEIAKICNEYEIGNWILNSNGTVDVDGNVWLSRSQIAKLPLKFGRVEDDFYCHDNNLTSLEGSPNYAGVDFSCSNNNLTSLIGCPQYVGDTFFCYSNNIRSFEGIGHIGGGFICFGNPIYCLWALFHDTSKIEMFNEWGVIQDDKVILYRLNDFLAEIGKDDVTEHQLYIIKNNYIVI